MPFLVLLWLASAFASEPGHPAEPDPATPSATSQPSTDPPPDPGAVSFATQLNEAKRAYFEGRVTEALRLFKELEVRLKVKGETPPQEEAAEAMTYLGEIHLAQNHPEAAEEAFRWVLERDIETPMRSPYRHPMEVVTLFEDVRVKVAREQREFEPPPPQFIDRPGRFPWYALVPAGIPQFWQRRPVAGALAASMQVGFGIASVVVYKNLQTFNAPNDLQGQELVDFQNEVRRREAFSVSLAVATYVSYVTWAFEAGIAAPKVRERTTLTISFTPEGAPALALHGRL
jgi:hypothetical protein